jgi:hypothetical protein
LAQLPRRTEVEGKRLVTTNIEGAAAAAVDAKPLKHQQYKLGW